MSASSSPARFRELAPKIGIALFVVTHLASLAWWNFAVYGMPNRPAAVVPSVTEPVRDAGRSFREPLRGSTAAVFFRGWVNLTGTWQNWEMFSEPPRRQAYVQLEGVDAIEDGKPIFDPEPVKHSATEDHEAFFLRNSRPPCGWRDGDRAAVSGYVQYHLSQRARARGRAYVGGRYRCHLVPLVSPERTTSAQDVEVRLLWRAGY